MSNRNIIGTITVPAGTARQSYETAAWYRTFEYDAQTVDVYLDADGNRGGYKLTGRYTYEYFPNLFGGVATGGGRIGETDEPGTFSVSLYGYTIAEWAEAGEITLADGYEVVESFHDHPVSCSGYSTDYSTGKAVYTACDHDVHEDAHYQPTVTERNSRGFLPFGYAPGVKDRKRHIKVKAKTTV